MSAPLSVADIIRKASPEPNTGCWLWTESDNGRGYGRISFRNKNAQAHRVFYELFCGPIPDNMELDHKCRVTFCVNPAHLEPVPHKVNVRRGVTGATTSARQRSKTHCPKGHAYAGNNLVIRVDGSRQCRTCVNTRKRPPKPRKAPQSHCKRGHPLHGSDVKLSGNLRICLICRRLRDKSRRRKSGAE
jgi:hypothetical protein